MNRKLKIALKRRASEQGFALPVALGMGLIMILVATTMILRSRDDQVTALAQKETAQGSSIGEGGISRVMAGFTKAQARSLLKRNHDPKQRLGSTDPDDEWATMQPIQPPVNSCDATARTPAQLIPDEGTIGSGTGAGTYSLLAYRYDSGTQTGSLLIKGKTNTDFSAQSQTRVNFPVPESPDSNTGLGSMMAGDINLRQTDVTGSITCIDRALCPLTCSNGATNPTLAQLRSAIGADSSNAVITNPSGGTPVINVGPVKIPDVPAVPASATIIDLGAVSSSRSVPSTTQITAHTAGTPYYFRVSSINRAPILINDSITDPVYFYVSGNIEQQGNDDIRFATASKTPSAGQVRIYGANTDGTLPSSQTFDFGGNSCTMAFIHAPNAATGITGGGNGCSAVAGQPNIYGGTWVKSFNVTVGNGSNSSIFVEQPNLIPTLISAYPSLPPMIPKAGSFSSWQRQEASP